ncbi:MAG: hypothetical protein ACRDJU_01360 [Actinomycetota bacterium]
MKGQRMRFDGRSRVAAAWPFLALGTGAVIGGGMLSAASSLAPTMQSSWAAGYLVLVAGVAQVFLGLGQEYLSHVDVGTARRGTELGCWNLGNALVLLGGILDAGSAIIPGSILLLAALAAFASATRHRSPELRWLQVGYRAMMIVLALSVPVGILLAQGHYSRVRL